MALSAKHQVFIDEYLICFNASEAARRAGYNGKSNVVGPRLFADVSIKAEIERRLKEKHLDADSVLARMSELAISDIVTFADVRRVTDLKDEKYKGKTHVIKKFKSKITTDALGRQVEEVELELYGADGLLDKMARHHGLYNDKVELSWRDKLPPNTNPDDVINQLTVIVITHNLPLNLHQLLLDDTGTYSPYSQALDFVAFCQCVYKIPAIRAGYELALLNQNNLHNVLWFSRIAIISGHCQPPETTGPAHKPPMLL